MRTFLTCEARGIEAGRLRGRCHSELFAGDPEMLFHRMRGDPEVARHFFCRLEFERAAQALLLAQRELGLSPCVDPVGHQACCSWHLVFISF